MHVHSLCVAIFLWNFVCHVFWHIAFYFSNNNLWNYKPPLELSHMQSQRVVWTGQLFSLWKVCANFSSVRLPGWVGSIGISCIFQELLTPPANLLSIIKPASHQRSTIMVLYMLCCGLHLWTCKESVLKLLCSLSLHFEPSIIVFFIEMNWYRKYVHVHVGQSANTFTYSKLHVQTV